MLGLAVFVSCYLSFLSFMIYVVICGNNKFHRNGCVGWWFRFFSFRLPQALSRATHLCLPCCISKGMTKSTCLGVGGSCRYMIACFYMFIYVLLSSVYISGCYPNLAEAFPNSYTIHRFFSLFVLPWPWLMFAILQVADPGVVTVENVESYIKLYKYDNMLYKRKICPTLLIPAPARSRFCKFTNRRIAKYDHYCPWVLAPIGERTHRFFLLFLVTNMISCIYLGTMHVHWIRTWIQSASPYTRWSDSKWHNALTVFDIALHRDSLLAASTIMLWVLAVVLFVFVCQQAYYISLNRTQVELDKIEWIEEDLDTPYVSHFYDHGLIRNWKDFFYPPYVAKHKPCDYSVEIERLSE